MTWKWTAVVSGFTLLAGWMGVNSAPPLATNAPQRSSSAAPVATARAAAAASDIQRQAARLHVRLNDRVDYREPTRNPFRFGARPAPARRAEPVRQAIELPPPPSVPVVPPITLAGIATDGEAGTAPQRTAILSTPVGVLLVKEGDAIGDAYRVVRIGEETVELSRTSDGSRIELRWTRNR
jgi:hypothetical protein